MFTLKEDLNCPDFTTGFNPLVGMIVVHTSKPRGITGRPKSFNPLVGMIVVHTTGSACSWHLPSTFQSPCRDDRCSHARGMKPTSRGLRFNPLVGMIVVHTPRAQAPKQRCGKFQSPCRDDRCSHVMLESFPLQGEGFQSPCRDDRCSHRPGN